MTHKPPTRVFTRQFIEYERFALNLYMSKEIIEWLTQEAHRTKKSRSELVRSYIVRVMQEQHHVSSADHQTG